MDKKLLDALNNLSYALEEIAVALNSKDDKPKSATSEALQTGKLDKKIQLIDKGVKQLLADNKKILKNQETLISISKQKSKAPEKEPLDKATDPKQKNKLKDGLASILMIAVGVLAIGLAFKLIGKVNFLSVIALALALPLVAMAFEKIAKMKDLKGAQMKNLVLITVAMSTAIVLSSFILGFVKPVGIFKLITAIFIAGMFAVIAYSIDKLVIGLRKIKMTDMKSIAMMPLVLVAVSAAIALSSYVLQLVRPVGIFKLFTAIFIAAMFGAISFGLGKLLKAFTEMKISPPDAAKAAILMPILLVAISAAIALSSHLLYMVKPVGIFKLFTAIFIAVAFIPIAFALPFIAKAIKDIDIKKVVLLPIIMVAMALTIWLTSLIFNQVEKVPFGKLFNIIFQSITLAIVSVALALAFKLVTKLTSVKDALIGGLIIIIIAATIAISSLILSKGDYTTFPPIEWIIGTGASVVIFGLVAVGLGYAISTIGPAIVLGLVAIVGVALTITITSKILAKGEYDSYPPIKWSMGVGLSMGAFAIGAVALGLIALTGIGAVAFLAGLPMMIKVAETIVDVSKVLAKGDYSSGFSMLPWVKSTALLYSTFVPILLDLGAVGLASAVLSFLGPDPWKKARRMMVQIAQTIVDVSFELQKGSYKAGPTKEWAEGVGLAISAFAPVYTALSENSGWISSGPTPEEMSQGIMTISRGIVEAAKFFGSSENTAVFDLTKIPDKKWGEGVGGAIQAFMPALEYISKNTGIFSGDGTKLILDGLRNTANGIAIASLFLSVGKYDKTIPESWMKNVSSNIKMYISLAKYLSDAGISTFSVIRAILGMSKLADGYAKLAEGVGKLGTELEKIDTEKLIALKNLTGSIVLMSLMDSDQFESMMNALEDKAKVFVDVINQLDEGEKKEAKKGTKAAPSPQVKTATKAGPPPKTMNDLYTIMQQVDSKLAKISQSSDNISKYVDEIKGGDLNLKK